MFGYRYCSGHGVTIQKQSTLNVLRRLTKKPMSFPLENFSLTKLTCKVSATMHQILYCSSTLVILPPSYELQWEDEATGRLLLLGQSARNFLNLSRFILPPSQCHHLHHRLMQWPPCLDQQVYIFHLNLSQLLHIQLNFNHHHTWHQWMMIQNDNVD